jgi:prepilin peptidase CpaA
MTNSALTTCLLIVLVTAAITDIRSYKIPNFLTFSGMLCGILYHTVQNGLSGFVFSAGGALVGMSLLIIFYLAGGMGAGDVKLLGSVGAFLGAKAVFMVGLYTAIIGGVYALLLIALNPAESKSMVTRTYISLRTFVCTGEFITIPPGADEKKLSLCYGVAIALGGMVYIYFESFGHSLPI